MVLTDTGFWLALFNANDKHHHRAAHYMASCKEDLITTWSVITETVYMLGKRLDTHSQQAFIDLLKTDLVMIADAEKAHLARVGTLMHKYADLPMDLADASLVLLAEELGHGRILSTDQRDFQTYRWKNHKPFENLLLPEA